MHSLTRICTCALMVGSTCLQGGAVSIEAEGTFTNCDFTSNSAVYAVSLEKEHVDFCEMSECMTLRLCLPHIFSSLTHSYFLYPFTVIVSCEWRSVLMSLTTLLHCCSSLPLHVHLEWGKSFCYLSSHIFSLPSLPSGRSFMNPLSTSS